MRKRAYQNRESGQMLIVFLLIMVVGLTIGLFLMSRTTSDISVTTRVTDSTRAFNAAEAGIEEAIRDLSGVTSGSPVPLASGLTYTVTQNSVGGGLTIYPPTVQGNILRGDVFTVWLAPHDTSGNLVETQTYTNDTMDICFAQVAGTTPAVEVMLFYKDNSGNYRNAFYGFDPDATRITTSHFEQAENVQNNTNPCYAQSSNTYRYRGVLNFTNDFGVNPAPASGNILLALRLRARYNTTKIGVIPYVTALPSQGDIIDSTGQTGEVARRIKVIRPYRVLPSMYDFAVFSFSQGTGLVK